MDNRCQCHNALTITLAVIIGILFGSMVAFLWVFNYIPQIRYVYPHATAAALLIFALTPIFALYFNKRSIRLDKECGRHHCPLGLTGYVVTTMISDVVFLLSGSVYAGMVLTRPEKIPVSFIGAIAFWVMLVVFLSMVFHLAKRR